MNKQTEGRTDLNLYNKKESAELTKNQTQITTLQKELRPKQKTKQKEPTHNAKLGMQVSGRA